MRYIIKHFPPKQTFPVLTFSPLLNIGLAGNGCGIDDIHVVAGDQFFPFIRAIHCLQYRQFRRPILPVYSKINVLRFRFIRFRSNLKYSRHPYPTLPGWIDKYVFIYPLLVNYEEERLIKLLVESNSRIYNTFQFLKPLQRLPAGPLPDTLFVLCVELDAKRAFRNKHCPLGLGLGSLELRLMIWASPQVNIIVVMMIVFFFERFLVFTGSFVR